MNRKLRKRRDTWKRYEWEALAALLKQGYPFQDAYELLQKDMRVLRELEKGRELQEVLLEGKRGVFYEHLRFFLPLISLGDAIHASLAMTDFLMKMRTMLIKQISYPLTLFVFSLMTLLLFSTAILPQLMLSFDFGEDMVMMQSAVAILQGIAFLILFLAAVACLAFLSAKINQRAKCFLLRCLRITKLPQQYASYLLAGYDRQMIHHGITTRNALAFLAQHQQGSLIRMCAKGIVHGLQEGNSMDDVLTHEIWLDPTFVQYWRIGNHTQNMELALSQYQKQQEEHWKQQFKHCGQWIQAGAYLFVAGMVILVYQIMLVPLQLLETM